MCATYVLIFHHRQPIHNVDRGGEWLLMGNSGHKSRYATSHPALHRSKRWPPLSVPPRSTPRHPQRGADCPQSLFQGARPRACKIYSGWSTNSCCPHFEHFRSGIGIPIREVPTHFTNGDLPHLAHRIDQTTNAIVRNATKNDTDGSFANMAAPFIRNATMKNNLTNLKRIVAVFNMAADS